MKTRVIFFSVLACIFAYVFYVICPSVSPLVTDNASIMCTVIFKGIHALGQTLEDFGIASRVNVLRFLTKPLRASLIPVSFEDVHVKDDLISGVSVRIYRPKNPKVRSETRPGVIHIHGGGMVFLSAHDVPIDKVCAHISNATQSVLISIEYRLAPEHIFPSQFEDVYSVVSTVIDSPSLYGITKSKVVIMGDSTGGLLTAAVSYQLVKEQRIDNVAAQVLIYPWLQMIDQTYLPSYKNYDKGFLVTREHITFFSVLATTGTQTIKESYMSGNISRYFMKTKYWKYLDLPIDDSMTGNTIDLPSQFVETVTDPRISPLLVDSFENLPATFVITAAYDSLRSESDLYVKNLKQDGGIVKQKTYPANHGFLFIDGGPLGAFPGTIEATNDIINYINEIFSTN